jgi:hypothetical protein
MTVISLDLLRKKSTAHMALVAALEAAHPRDMGTSSNTADWIIETLWQAGFKIARRDDIA